MDHLEIAERLLREPTHPTARDALFSAACYQPLQGLNAKGAGHREP